MATGSATVPIPPDPGGQGGFTAGLGPENLDIRFTVENDTDYDRVEVIGIMCPFPQGPNGVAPEDISNYHFRLLKSATVGADEDLPTSWTILTTWPDGKVRWAKGWCGRASGSGVLIPKRDSATNPRGIQYLKLIRDNSLSSSLPSYSEHPSVTAGLATGNLVSEVYDIFGNSTLLRSGNRYIVDLFNSAYWYEDVTLESTAWMKVVRRRGYHRVVEDLSGPSSLRRDFLSLTWYLYIPHNSRFIDLEVRLGNDYQGRDPYEHKTTVTIGTGDGVKTNFTYTLANVLNGVGTFGEIPKNSVTVVADKVTAEDNVTRGGNKGLLVGDGLETSVDSTIGYSDGSLDVTFASPPRSGVPVQVTYKHPYAKMYSGDGITTSFSGFTTEKRPNAYSIHVVALNSAGGIAAEGKDNGLGQLVPFYHTNVEGELAGTGDSSTTSFNYTTSNSNILPGSVTVRAGDQIWGRDDGKGEIRGPGMSISPVTVINYATGEIKIRFDSAPNGNIYVDYSYDPNHASTLEVSGSVNYTTGAIDPQFRTAPDGDIYVSYIRNHLSTSFTHDPNDFPLGPIAFNRWTLTARSSDITGFVMEAEVGYRAQKSSGGGSEWYNIAVSKTDPLLGGSPIPPGGLASAADQPENLNDGCSIVRLFFLYFGSGASASENDTWSAKQVHPLTPIATREAVNATRAVGHWEGGIRFITPEQNVSTSSQTRSASTESIARDSSGLSNVKGYVGAIQMWNNGDFRGVSRTPGVLYGARPTYGWLENISQPNTTGAIRNGHIHCAQAYASQAWQAVRYYYHTAFSGYQLRPGQVLWNFESAFRWRTRSYYEYHSAGGDWGFIPSKRGGRNFQNNQDELNRRFRVGFGDADVEVVNNSSTIIFNTRLFDIVPMISHSKGTYLGSTVKNGLLRCFIEGSDKIYEITAFYRGSDQRWRADLDTPYDGSTSTSRRYAIFNDPEPGSSFLPKNDARSYGKYRMGFPTPIRQHGFKAENSSHAAQDTPYEVWEMTGSWMLWDKVRHFGEFFLGSYKDHSPFGEDIYGDFQYRDEERANAWVTKAVLQGYLVIKYLQDNPAFTFLSSEEYGKARDRFLEWFEYRYDWFLARQSPLGLMDPKGIIATGGKHKIKDAPVLSNLGGEWVPEFIGPKDTVHTNLTTCQVRYGEKPYWYSSTWQLGYWTPYIWAIWREVRNLSQRPALPKSGERLPNLFFRLAEGMTRYIIEYCIALGTGPWPSGGTKENFWKVNFPTRIVPDLGNPIRVVKDGIVTTAPLKSAAPKYPDVKDSEWPISTYYNRLGSQSAVDWWRAKDPNGIGKSWAPGIDVVGWDIPGTERDPHWGGKQTTSFDDGIPHGGQRDNNFKIPGCNNTPPRYPCYRPPLKAATMAFVGQYQSGGLPRGINASTAPSIRFASLFDSDSATRQLAADYLNRWFYGLIAYSYITQDHYPVRGVAPTREGEKLEFENKYLAMLSADFPFAPSQGGDITAWWDTSWLKRRRISSGTSHSQYSANKDVFSFFLDSYGITNTTDIRIVYQADDGSFTVLSHTTRRDPVVGVTKCFVIPTADIPANEEIGTSKTYAYYIYYDNATAKAPGPWTNTLSIDGPYESDASTVALWDAEGGWNHDRGPNSLIWVSVPPLIPKHLSGPFGGAIGFEGAQAAILPYTTVFAPSGDFCLEMKFYIEARDLTPDRMMVFMSCTDDTTVAIFVYMVTSLTDRKIRGRFSIGQGASFTVHEVSIDPGGFLSIGTGDGVQVSFSGSLSNVPVEKNTVFVYLSNDTSVEGRDDGNGAITGNGISSGTIDYTTGAISVTFSSPPSAGASVEVTWAYKNNQWYTDREFHIKFDYTGSTLTAYLNGVAGTSVLASGGLAPLPVSNDRFFAIGCSYTPSTQFQLFAMGRMAEIRFSSASRASTYHVTDPAEITLQGEESLRVEKTLSVSSSGVMASMIRSLISSIGRLLAPKFRSISSSGNLVKGVPNLQVPSSGAIASLLQQGILSGGHLGGEVRTLVLSGGVVAGRVSNSLPSGGALGHSLTLLLPSNGILAGRSLSSVSSSSALALSLTEVIPSGGVLRFRTETAISASARLQVRNVPVSLPSSGRVLSPGFVPLTTEASLALVSTASSITAGLLAGISFSPLSSSSLLILLHGSGSVPSSGILAVISTSSISSSGHIEIPETRYSSVDGSGYILRGVREDSISSSGVLAITSVVSLSSGARLGIVATVEVSSSGILIAVDVEVSVSTLASLSVLGSSSVSSSGSVAVTNSEAVSSSGLLKNPGDQLGGVTIDTITVLPIEG